MNTHSSILLKAGVIQTDRSSRMMETYKKTGMVPTRLIRGNLPGRNDPCLCKSGKKFKQCCMRMIKPRRPLHNGEPVGAAS